MRHILLLHIAQRHTVLRCFILLVPAVASFCSSPRIASLFAGFQIHRLNSRLCSPVMHDDPDHVILLQFLH